MGVFRARLDSVWNQFGISVILRTGFVGLEVKAVEQKYSLFPDN